MTTKQTELWEGVFGDAYQERNQLDEAEVEKRVKFLRQVFVNTYRPKQLTSILEIGAGQGPNICAWQKISIETAIPLNLYATEINRKARIALLENCPQVGVLDEIPKVPFADMVYTYGVLIHTHPAHLRLLQEKMYNASKRFVMFCEYFAPDTRAIPYRGEKDALWLDDYGKKFMDNFDVGLVTYGFAWKPYTGLDNITYWVFQKKGAMS